MFLAFVYVVTYAALLWIMYELWKQIPVQSTTDIDLSEATVVIPFRNEGDKIINLVNQKPRQVHYILVDDHSSDLTEEVRAQLSSVPGITLLVSSGVGKKAAIETGVHAAKTPYILTTDADCDLDPQWSKTMLAGLRENGFVFGPLLLSAHHSVEIMQQYEMAILQMVSGSCWQWGTPTMCNGANLGFRRSDFQALHGYDSNRHITSGDDVMLMHAFSASKRVGDVGFVKPEQPLVATSAQRSLRKLYHQRKRWAGKWKGYKQKAIRWFAVAVFGVNLIWLILLAWLLSVGAFLPAVVLLTGKMLTEAMILGKLRSYFQFNLRFGPLIMLSLVYPFYVVFFGMVSHFGTYKWKGRVIRN